MVKKSIFVFILVVAILFNLCGCFSDLSAEKEVVASGDLAFYASMNDDQLEEYKYEYIEVSGIVSNVLYTSLKIGDSLSDELVIECHFPDSDTLEQIDDGDYLVIRGDVSTYYASTYFSSSLTLRNCQIISCTKASELQTETTESVTEFTAETTDETNSEPVTETTSDSINEPASVPTAEPTVAPTTEPAVVPTTEPTVAPTTEPTVAPTTEPPETSTPATENNAHMVWIPTNGGTKYHTHSGCSNMEDPRYVTLEEAEALGFTPCKRCH